MSKSSKAASKKKNAQAKRAKKAANQAMWQAMKEKGQNQKSLRARKSAKAAKKVNGISHPEGRCGNIGCQHCNPNEFRVTTKYLTNGKQILRVLAARKLAA